MVVAETATAMATTKVASQNQEYRMLILILVFIQVGFAQTAALGVLVQSVGEQCNEFGLTGAGEVHGENHVRRSESNM